MDFQFPLGSNRENEKSIPKPDDYDSWPLWKKALRVAVGGVFHIVVAFFRGFDRHR
jgi:hypothetical protein